VPNRERRRRPDARAYHWLTCLVGRCRRPLALVCRTRRRRLPRCFRAGRLGQTERNENCNKARIDRPLHKKALSPCRLSYRKVCYRSVRLGKAVYTHPNADQNPGLTIYRPPMTPRGLLTSNRYEAFLLGRQMPALRRSLRGEAGGRPAPAGMVPRSAARGSQTAAPPCTLHCGRAGSVDLSTAIASWQSTN